MKFDSLGFTPHYDAEASSASSGRNLLGFHRLRSRERTGELALEVPQDGATSCCAAITHINGNGWTGIFEKGVGRYCGLFGTPNPDVVCVVCGGQGFWVDVTNPGIYEVVPSSPVVAVIRVPDKQVLVFVDYVRLCAYGECGFLWQSDDVSWDGIKITSVSSEFVSGRGWDAPNNADVDFTVSVDDGSHQGGAAPSRRRLL